MQNHYLSKEELAEFNAMLLKKKADLSSRLKELSEAFLLSNERTAETIEEASNSADRVLTNSERNRCGEEVIRITSIINNFDDYGYCTSPICGQEIGKKRLMFNPSFTVCVDCQSLSERSGR